MAKSLLPGLVLGALILSGCGNDSAARNNNQPLCPCPSDAGTAEAQRAETQRAETQRGQPQGAPCPEVEVAAKAPAPDNPSGARAGGPKAPAVKLGIDVLLDSRADLVEGKKVGLITNSSAVDGALAMTVDRLIDDPRVKVVQLYSPEHGLAGAMRNGQSDKEASYERGGRKIPVQGLTGDRWQPSPESLRKIDVLIFDIQDIGSRTYTYISTLGLAMQAARAAKVPIIVLDRPNPLGGLVFEGPIREEQYKSFIGWGPLPVSHGMTAGEVARFYNEELKIGCELIVVEMEGWRRQMVWQDTGLTWVPTSPGIPHPHNAQLYIATGMVGGSGPNVNEGGGNSMPFELIGALFVDDPRILADRLNAAGLPGLTFRPLIYRPWGRQFKDMDVAGVHLMVHDPAAFRPLRTALTILTTLQALYGDELVIDDDRRFGRTWGNDWILPMIRRGKTPAEIEARWAPELDAFAQKRARHLIYP